MKTKSEPSWPFANLDEMIRSQAFEYFRENRLGNDLWINDPDRADRIRVAAEDGCDGSFHAERIQDWRDFLSDYREYDPEFDEPFQDGRLPAEIIDAITAEIDACEAYHESKGTLWEEVG